MTLYLRLYWEFFKTGLFAIGGGMATLPFLKDIGATTGWFSQTDLMNMLAVSESTPGPVGINMATYVGYTVGGVPGAIVATIGEVTPSIIVILIVAAMLAKFRDSQYVANAFYGLRPASTGLIGAACAGVMIQVIAGITSASQADSILMKFSWDGAISWRGIILALVLLVFTRYIKKTKDLHPIVFIGVSAVIGVVFHFAASWTSPSPLRLRSTTLWAACGSTRTAAPRCPSSTQPVRRPATAFTARIALHQTACSRRWSGVVAPRGACAPASRLPWSRRASPRSTGVIAP